MVNRAWVGLYRGVVPEAALNEAHNHFDFLFSRQGAGTPLRGWQDTLSVILMSLQQGALMRGTAESQAVVDRLMSEDLRPGLVRENQQLQEKLVASFDFTE